MEPAAFAHWRRWQVPLCRAAIFRLSTIACWLPLADNRKHHTRASPEKAGALNLGPGGIHLSFAALHESAFGTKRTSLSLSAMSAIGVKQTSRGRAPMSAFDPNRTFSPLRLDPRRFDERPPFVDLGLVKNAKSLRRLLFARGNFRSEIGDLSSDGRISKRFSDSGIKLGNDRPWRALG